MDLNDLIPERVQWKPSLNGEKDGESKELEFYFRPFNLEDESWLKREFGEKQLQEIFEQLQMDKVARIAFRQLEVDSKRRLMDIKFIDIDEDGNEYEIALKGPDKVSALTYGLPEQLELLKMLLRTRGVSMPILDELGKRIVEESAMRMTDSLDEKQTGPSSLI